MASASVVGQHPGQHFKLPGVGKKITLSRRQSGERLMYRRSGGGGSSEECGSVTAEGELDTQPLSPRGPAGETAASGGMMLGEGCGAAAPRSANRDREEGSGAGCATGHTVTGRRESQTGARNSNMDMDSNHNTGAARRGASLRRPGINVMLPGESVANGHKGSHRHRDRDAPPHGRRDSGRGGDSGHQLTSSVLPERGGLPPRRLYQSKTGVVKLARPERSRREAWSIFPQREDPRVKTERGEGHQFKPGLAQDWCDACSRMIRAQALKCQNCSYTCHLECQSQVQLDCNQRDRQPEKTPSPRSTGSSSTALQHKQNETKEEEEGGTKENLSEEEVRARIEEYNAQVTENGMKPASDGFTGFIKVHLRLSRPVTVAAVEPASVEGASRLTGSGQSRAASEDQEGTDGAQSEKKSSFYLPCDCVKQLHISSMTTTGEVIQGLLKKYMVLDNPRKFALYRQTHRDGQDLFQKLPLYERPLLLRLIAGPDPQQLTFVLKENETGEVEWHAFSVPELQNFLVILEKEEAERVRAVHHKYAMYRQKLQQALQQHDP